MKITVVGLVAMIGVMVLLAFIAYQVGTAIEQNRRENLAMGNRAGAPNDSDALSCEEPQVLNPSGC